MQILNHIHHKLYGQNHEARQIWRSTQPEVDTAAGEVVRIFENTRVNLIDLEAHPEDLAIWEATYDILPDLVQDTPEERRERVLERKLDRPPFTETWLIGNEVDDYGYRKMGGIIGARFPDGDVFVEVDGLRLYVYFDISGGRLNERGFTCREFRELLPWFRSWVPSNVLLVSKATSTKDEVVRDVFVGGAAFKMTQKTAVRPITDHDIKMDVALNGHAFKVTQKVPQIVKELPKRSFFDENEAYVDEDELFLVGA